IDYDKIPDIMVLDLNDTHHNTLIEKDIKITAEDEMSLRGIIYFGNFHYNARIVQANGDIWFNNGIVTGENSIYEGHISTFNRNDLNQKNSKYATALIYTR
ncbi:hypothetical protein JAAARDRAFT_104478, partial [Jaapia argillacea MUCL 33604]